MIKNQIEILKKLILFILFLIIYVIYLIILKYFYSSIELQKHI